MTVVTRAGEGLQKIIILVGIDEGRKKKNGPDQTGKFSLFLFLHNVKSRKPQRPRFYLKSNNFLDKFVVVGVVGESSGWRKCVRTHLQQVYTLYYVRIILPGVYFFFRFHATFPSYIRTIRSRCFFVLSEDVRLTHSILSSSFARAVPSQFKIHFANATLRRFSLVFILNGVARARASCTFYKILQLDLLVKIYIL